MNDNEPLAQLLEETRQTNRLLCRQLTWSRILAVVLAIIAAAAVVLAAIIGIPLLGGLFQDLAAALGALARHLNEIGRAHVRTPVTIRNRGLRRVG